MVSMNQSLSELVERGLVNKDEALEASNDKDELQSLFKGVYRGSKNYYE